ncbi:MAG: hypothetical protein H6Q66_1454 [Firmicutes bacterium]|nr:hypothetical protein [Bacillota bacterium]
MTRNRMIYGVLTLLLLVGVPLTGFAESQTSVNGKPILVSVVSTTVSPEPVVLADICPIAGKFDGSVSVYAKNLKTGQVMVFNPDQIFASASTIKVPVSVVMYRQFYDLADQETRRKYDNGISLMLSISDNDYFADFLDEIEETIGPEIIQQHFVQLGMKNTTLRDPQARKDFGYSNVTTAVDMGLFFEQFYLGNLINNEKTNFMKDALTNTIFNDELPRYMQGRRVLHKVGELDDILADVGVVEGEAGPVIISIFTKTTLDTDYASDYIAALSACIYRRLTGETTDWKGL